MSSSGRYYNNDNGTGSSSTTATNNTNHNNNNRVRYYQSNFFKSEEEKEEMNNDENAQPKGKNHRSSHFQHQQKSSASTTTAKELLHRARSEIVNQVRKDIRNSSNTSSSHGGDFRHEREALKENNTNNKDGLGFQSRFPSAYGGAQNIDGNDEQQRVAREKQRLEEKRRKAQMAETSLHEKMDETKERIMERGGGGRSRAAAANTTTTHTTHNSSKNVSQWMDSVVAKARHDASMSPPLQQHSRNNNNSSNNNSSATESLREAAKNAREAVTRAVYGTATARHDEGKENTPPPVVRRSFSDPSPSSSMNYQQHEETDAKVTKAMLKSALKQTGELRTELRETKLTLDGVKENLETAENDLKKEKENREEDKLNFEAAKNELETSREAAREALAREVSVTQELTKKLSAKRDEALEQRNLADKFKRELEQLRSELRNLKNENESWIRKAEAANETSRRRSGDQQKDVPKVSSSFPQQQQQRPQQNEQQKVNATTTTTTTTAQTQQSQQQQLNWSRERREAEELKTKGNRAFHANKFDEALQSYTAALQVNFEDQPFRAVLHANRAAALQSLKKHLEAIVACCESQFFDKSYVRAIQRRADAYLSIGDWTMAAKDLEALVPIMGKECDAKLREVKMNIQRGVHIEHYAVLGVSSRANASEIRASYLKKSLKHHPDKAETEHTKEIAELMFKRVVEAYKVLSDANARRAYDNKRILGSSNAYNRRY